MNTQEAKSKIIIILGVFLLFFISCSPRYDRASLSKWESRTLDDLEQELHTKITYQQDPEGGYWQSPGSTEKWLHGDCEDYTLLFMDLADQLGHEDIQLVIYDSGTGYSHAVACVDGIMYDPTNNIIITYTRYFNLKKRYSFAEAMRLIDN